MKGAVATSAEPAALHKQARPLDADADAGAGAHVAPSEGVRSAGGQPAPSRRAREPQGKPQGAVRPQVSQCCGKSSALREGLFDCLIGRPYRCHLLTT